MHENIRHVAFLTSGDLWPNWLARASRRLRDISGVQVVSHIHPRQIRDSRGRKRRRFSRAVYKRLEQRSYNPTGWDALAPAVFNGDNSLAFESSSDLWSWLEASNPDLIICEGDVPASELRNARRVGCPVWMFNENWSTGLPASCARAALSGQGWVGLSLCDITNPDNCHLLCETASQLSSLTMRNNLNQHFRKMAMLPERALGASPGPHSCRSARVAPLRPREEFRLSFKLLSRRLSSKISRSDDRAWTIALGKTHEGSGLETCLNDLTILQPPPGRFWADPCLVSDNDRTYLFYEELAYGEDIGYLAAAEVAADGTLRNPRTVLKEDRHMSYPNVFKHEGSWYMIPETGDSNRVDLYRAEAFPYRWVFEKTLMRDIRLFDASVIKHGGYWWMFGSVAENGMSDYDELHVFHTRDLLHGSWQAHPLNPVVSDVRSARPAGRMFARDGAIYRPSQDSRERYGYGVVMNKIAELSTSAFREEPVWRWDPDTLEADVRGVHTFSTTAETVAIDMIRP